MQNFRNYMVTPLGRSMDAADGTLPAEVAESAAGRPYSSGGVGHRSRLAAAAGGGTDTATKEQASSAGAGGRARVGKGGAAAVMASALAGQKEEKAVAAVKAPQNPWVAPPEAAVFDGVAEGVLSVATVAPVAAGEVAEAVAEGVQRSRVGRGIGEMVRTSVGEVAPWQQLDQEKVLEAWHRSGGDVDAMAKELAGPDGA